MVVLAELRQVIHAAREVPHGETDARAATPKPINRGRGRQRTPTFSFPGKLKRRTGKKAPLVILESESKRENPGAAQLVMTRSVRNSQVRLEDVVVLYRTLVRDRPLPAGFEEAFSTLAPHISPAATRQQGRLAMTNNTQAALDLHE